MKQKKLKRNTTALFLLLLAIMLITAGCGNFVDGSSAMPNSENGMNQGDVLNDPFTEASETGNDHRNSVTLSWSAPSMNADGTPLAGDIAGFIVYYGQGTGNYTDSVDIGDVTSVSVSDLTQDTWCFTVTAYDSVGNESDFSEETCKTLF